MNGIVYAQINLIPMMALIFLFMNSKARLTISLNNHLLRAIILLLVCIMAADAVAWALHGKADAGVRAWLLAANYAYFVLIGVLPYLWFLYVCDRLFELKLTPWLRALFALPLAVYFIALLITPWRHSIFFIDEQNLYHRGSMIVLQQASGLLYMLASTVLSLASAMKADGDEKRREARTLSMFILLPILGALLQIHDPDTAFLWPFTASSVIVVYIGLQHGQISLDALTGLNNRRRLNQYMNSLISHSSHAWYFALLDVDHFKNINDEYGHLIGDEALKIVADVMKAQFSHRNAFIARYGGDEFAVVLISNREEAVARELSLLQIAVREASQRRAHPWRLSVSVGYAKWEAGESCESLIARADVCMYEDKAKNRLREDYT